jgi:hypothetical protein
MIVLRGLALAIVLVVWLIIGPLLWIPLIIRTIAFVMVNLMATVFTGASMAPSQASLDAALRLYGRGFRAAFAVLDNDPDTNPPPLLRSHGYIRLFAELVYVALFWLGTVSLVLMLMRISPSAILQSHAKSSGSSGIQVEDKKPDIAPFFPPQSGTPIYTVVHRGFLFKVYRCGLSRSRVRCDFTVENQQADRNFTLGIGKSDATSDYNEGGGTLVDDRGNGYRSTAGALGRLIRTDCDLSDCRIDTVALRGAAIPAWIAFDDVDENATIAKLVRLRFGSGEYNWGPPAELRDIEITR